MKLTREQIDYIFDFVKKHYVEWYDLQVEMVDHLANDIEKIMTENPKISFENALDRAFRKFGPAGFMEVAEQKMNAIKKSYFKYIFQEFKYLFLSPKIFLFLFSWYLFYSFLFHTSYKLYTIVFIYLIITVIPFYFLVKYSSYLRKKKKNNQKVYLAESSIVQAAAIIYFLLVLQLSLQSFIKIYNKIDAGQVHDKFYLIFSVISIVFFWFYYYAFVSVPRKMISQTLQKYEDITISV